MRVYVCVRACVCVCVCACVCMCVSVSLSLPLFPSFSISLHRYAAGRALPLLHNPHTPIYVHVCVGGCVYVCVWVCGCVGVCV